MSRTQTIFVDLQRLSSCGESASVIIRLMMACNDISLANQGLARYKEEQPAIKSHVQRGAGMYFIRLQCGHLNEAMKIISEIRDNERLRDRVEKCSHIAREAFDRLTNCLKGDPGNRDFERYVGRIRHSTVFHYAPKTIDKALNDRASRPEASRSKITRGDHISLWRFELADDILDSVVCRQIWNIPRTANLPQEADLKAEYGSNLCQALLSFSGEFIFRFVQEHAAI